MTAGPEPGRAPFWPRRSPAFLSARRAVRAALSDAAPRGVVVGLSGGADSLALTAACIAEVAWPPDAGARTPNARGSGGAGGADGADGAHGTGANVAPVHAVVVDHGLQRGSGEVARRAADAVRELGATAEIIAVDVPDDPAAGGPEAAARTARHAALHDVAARLGRPLLLAHTLDDQAETVLLALARGSGPTALSGMADDRTWADGVRVLRPLIGLRRADTEETCAELGLDPWHDPHNTDRRFARARARHDALPILEELLGPGIAQNLARTAALARRDARALDDWAADAVTRALGDDGKLRLGDVGKLPEAVRTRALKKWAEGSGAGALTAANVAALDKLVTERNGRGPVALPAAQPGGRLVVARKGGTLAVSRGIPPGTT